MDPIVNRIHRTAQEHECPQGGDIANDCEGCAYCLEYRYDTRSGECVRRERQTDLEKSDAREFEQKWKKKAEIEHSAETLSEMKDKIRTLAYKVWEQVDKIDEDQMWEKSEKLTKDMDGKTEKALRSIHDFYYKKLTKGNSDKLAQYSPGSTMTPRMKEHHRRMERDMVSGPESPKDPPKSKMEKDILKTPTGFHKADITVTAEEVLGSTQYDRMVGLLKEVDRLSDRITEEFGAGGEHQRDAIRRSSLDTYQFDIKLHGVDIRADWMDEHEIDEEVMSRELNQWLVFFMADVQQRFDWVSDWGQAGRGGGWLVIQGDGLIDCVKEDVLDQYGYSDEESWKEYYKEDYNKVLREVTRKIAPNAIKALEQRYADLQEIEGAISNWQNVMARKMRTPQYWRDNGVDLGPIEGEEPMPDISPKQFSEKPRKPKQLPKGYIDMPPEEYEKLWQKRAAMTKNADAWYDYAVRPDSDEYATPDTVIKVEFPDGDSPGMHGLKAKIKAKELGLELPGGGFSEQSKPYNFEELTVIETTDITDEQVAQHERELEQERVNRREEARRGLVAIYDEGEAVDDEVKYRKTDGLFESDYIYDGNEEITEVVEKFKDQPDGEEKVWAELKRLEIDDELEKLIEDSVYSHTDIFDIHYENFIESLEEQLKEKNPRGDDWYVRGEGMGWQSSSGEKTFGGDVDAKGFLEEIMPRTSSVTIHVFERGPQSLEFVVYHHDAPTGEHYYASPAKRRPTPEEWEKRWQKKAELSKTALGFLTNVTEHYEEGKDKASDYHPERSTLFMTIQKQGLYVRAYINIVPSISPKFTITLQNLPTGDYLETPREYFEDIWDAKEKAKEYILHYQWVDTEKAMGEKGKKFEQRWQKKAELEKEAWGSGNIHPQEMKKVLDGEKKSRRHGNYRYEIDDRGIFTMTYYSTDVVTVDTNTKEILDVTTGGYDNSSTRNVIDDVLSILSGYGYKIPDMKRYKSDYEYNKDNPPVWSEDELQERDLRVRELTPEREREIAKNPKKEIRRELAWRSHDPEVLTMLAHDPDRFVIYNLIKNEHLPLEVREELSRSDDSGIRKRVATSYHTSPAIKKRLAQDPDESVRAYIADKLGHSSDDNPVMDILKKDKSSYVRFSLIKGLSRYNYSMERVGEFLHDPDKRIRMYIAKNSGDEAVLAELAKDTDRDVLYAVLMNEGTPVDVMVQFAMNPDLQLKIAFDRYEGRRYYSRMPAEVSAVLAKSEQAIVRAKAAESTNATPETLIELSKDPEEDVRYYVAGNENTPIRVLREMRTDPSEKVKERIGHRMQNLPRPSPEEWELRWQKKAGIQWEMNDDVIVKPGKYLLINGWTDAEQEVEILRSFDAKVVDVHTDGTIYVKTDFGADGDYTTITEDAIIGGDKISEQAGSFEDKWKKEASYMSIKDVENQESGNIISITVVPGAREIPAIDRLEPMPYLWWENEAGEKFLPSEDDIKEMFRPQGYPLMHSCGPQVTENIFDENGKEVMVFNNTINCIEDIVLYLVIKRGWKLTDAITIAANTCERCLNILIEQSGGEKYDPEDKARVHTHCDLCATIDPEYDREYKQNEIVVKESSNKKLEIRTRAMTILNRMMKTSEWGQEFKTNTYVIFNQDCRFKMDQLDAHGEIKENMVGKVTQVAEDLIVVEIGKQAYSIPFIEAFKVLEPFQAKVVTPETPQGNQEPQEAQPEMPEPTEAPEEPAEEAKPQAVRPGIAMERGKPKEPTTTPIKPMKPLEKALQAESVLRTMMVRLGLDDPRKTLVPGTRVMVNGAPGKIVGPGGKDYVILMDTGKRIMAPLESISLGATLPAQSPFKPKQPVQKAPQPAQSPAQPTQPGKWVKVVGYPDSPYQGQTGEVVKMIGNDYHVRFQDGKEFVVPANVVRITGEPKEGPQPQAPQPKPQQTSKEDIPVGSEVWVTQKGEHGFPRHMSGYVIKVQDGVYTVKGEHGEMMQAQKSQIRVRQLPEEKDKQEKLPYPPYRYSKRGLTPVKPEEEIRRGTYVYVETKEGKPLPFGRVIDSSDNLVGIDILPEDYSDYFARESVYYAVMPDELKRRLTEKFKKWEGERGARAIDRMVVTAEDFEPAKCLECDSEIDPQEATDIQLCARCSELFDLDKLWAMHDSGEINVLDFNEMPVWREWFRIKNYDSEKGKKFEERWKKKAEKEYEHEINIDGNQVGYNYRDDYTGEMDEGDIEHLKQMLHEGMVEGELNTGEEEHRGWWTLIEKAPMSEAWLDEWLGNLDFDDLESMTMLGFWGQGEDKQNKLIDNLHEWWDTLTFEEKQVRHEEGDLSNFGDWFKKHKVEDWESKWKKKSALNKVSTKYCPKCGVPVERENPDITGYSWGCPQCEEGFYNFEVVDEPGAPNPMQRAIQRKREDEAKQFEERWKKKSTYSEGCECGGDAYPAYREDTGELILMCDSCGQEFESDESQWIGTSAREKVQEFEDRWTRKSQGDTMERVILGTVEINEQELDKDGMWLSKEAWQPEVKYRTEMIGHLMGKIERGINVAPQLRSYIDDLEEILEKIPPDQMVSAGAYIDQELKKAGITGFLNRNAENEVDKKKPLETLNKIMKDRDNEQVKQVRDEGGVKAHEPARENVHQDVSFSSRMSARKRFFEKHALRGEKYFTGENVEIMTGVYKGKIGKIREVTIDATGRGEASYKVRMEGGIGDTWKNPSELKKVEIGFRAPAPREEQRETVTASSEFPAIHMDISAGFHMLMNELENSTNPYVVSEIGKRLMKSEKKETKVVREGLVAK